MEHGYDWLFGRENPFYRRNVLEWRRSLSAYSGGREYIDKALIPHLAEIPSEFTERKKRAYYFNYPRRVAQLITQYVLATRPERENADEDYCEDFSRSGLRVDEVMRQFSMYLNLFGMAWLVVDMPAFDGVKTKADEIREKLRPYVVALSPVDVPDWSVGRDGELDWVLTKEHSLDNSNPLSDPVELDIRKLWTRNSVTTVIKDSSGNITTTTTEHNLGVVPFVKRVEIAGYGIGCNHWFEDVVRISDAILNNESEAQMNTIKQMFGLLVVSETFANSAERTKDDAPSESETDSNLSNTISRSAAIIESADDKGISRYIAPSGIENQTIRSDNQTLIRLMFECVGLSVSKDTKLVESSEAKEWDFQGVEQLLRTMADALEQSEVQAWKLLQKWNSSISIPTVSYNRNFSLLNLPSAVATLTELAGFNTESPDYQKEIDRTAVVLLNRLRQLSQGKHKEISKQIDDSIGNVDKNISI